MIPLKDAPREVLERFFVEEYEGILLTREVYTEIMENAKKLGVSVTFDGHLNICFDYPERKGNTGSSNRFVYNRYPIWNQ